MIWTEKKPTEDGYYWLRMKETDVFAEQPPRVVFVGGADGLTFVMESPDFEPDMPLDEASEHFEWSSDPVQLPQAT